MHFYLTGGGDQELFRSLDKRFLESLADSSRVAVLPHASEDYEDTFERIKEDFRNKKVSSFELVTDADESLLDFDALMIEGGNTFELIKTMRESAFFDLIKAFALTGKPIYADSAGAIMLGSDVQTAFLGDDADTDHQKLQDYRGLDLLSGWAVHAHATHEEYEDLNNLLYDKGNPIFALAEETGILIDGGEYEVFGKEPLEIFTFEGRKSLIVGAKGKLDV
jgi:peptidase E